MKRLSFLWLLLFATSSMSYAAEYPENQWEPIGWVDYWKKYLFLQDSIYYDFNSNSAYVSFLYESNWGGNQILFMHRLINHRLR